MLCDLENLCICGLDIEMVDQSGIPLSFPGQAIKTHQESTESALRVREVERGSVIHPLVSGGPHACPIVLGPENCGQNIRDLCEQLVTYCVELFEGNVRLSLQYQDGVVPNL